MEGHLPLRLPQPKCWGGRVPRPPIIAAPGPNHGTRQTRQNSAVGVVSGGVNWVSRQSDTVWTVCAWLTLVVWRLVKKFRPIHYTTFIGLRRRLRFVNSRASPMLKPLTAWPCDLDLWLLTLNSCRTWRVTWPTLPPNFKTLRLFVHELRVINTKNCSLSIVLTATDQKPQKS